MNPIALIDKLLINLCIDYKYVLLLPSTDKRITIFLSVGIKTLANKFGFKDVSIT